MLTRSYAVLMLTTDYLILFKLAGWSSAGLRFELIS